MASCFCHYCTWTAWFWVTSFFASMNTASWSWYLTTLDTLNTRFISLQETMSVLLDWNDNNPKQKERVNKICTVIDVLSSTEWHRLSHTWLLHFNARPQIRPQDDGFEFQHGHKAVSWPPIQSTGTWISHRGCGNFRISYFSGWISHGPAGLKFLSIIWTLTASWHFAVHGWSQLVVSFISKHCSIHGGHSYMWQLCAFGWWHFDGILQGKKHFGGFVFFSRPHDTLIDVFPHLSLNTIKKINISIYVIEIQFILPAFNTWYQIARIALAVMTHWCTFVFATRQHFPANFITRWTITIATLT